MAKKAKINREHKATLFALVFSDAGDALSLYNAMNGTDYDDPDQLPCSLSCRHLNLWCSITDRAVSRNRRI